ncbi:MAG: PilN domain-containing protein [Elusimicrobiota bacterium]
MIKINLVPGEILAKARQRQLLLQAGFIGGLLAVVLVLISLVHWAGLHSLQTDYLVKQSKLKDLGTIVAKVEDLEAASAAVRSRLNVIDSLLKGRSFYPLFMSEFARTVPAGVKVMTMGTSTQASDTMKLTISAVAETNDDVASWMRTLEGNSHFGSVELGPVSASGHQYNFTISTVYTLKL